MRLINIHIARPNIRLSVVADSTPLTWRALAKDVVTLAPRHAVSGPAVQTVSVGETYDFALTPPAPGPLRIEVRSQAGVLLATQRVIVE